MVLSVSRMSELRIRKRAVCVRAGTGICRLEVLVVRKVLSQALETGRCLVWRRVAESWSWRVVIFGGEWRDMEREGERRDWMLRVFM